MVEDWIVESNKIEDVHEEIAHTASQAAWDWFKKQPLTLESILQCHSQIYHLFDPKVAGVWRPYDVCVGTEICPSWRRVPKLMSEWLKKHGKAMKWEDIREAHATFEKIHPFADGNGRTGRMVMNWQRVKAGMKPLCIKAAERWDYYKWFHKTAPSRETVELYKLADGKGATESLKAPMINPKYGGDAE